MGVPSDFVQLCGDIYTGSVFRVRFNAGWTEDIPQLRGVKQGCPLSPLLFNLAVEGMLRGVESLPVRYTLSDGQKISCLAYADVISVWRPQPGAKS